MSEQPTIVRVGPVMGTMASVHVHGVPESVALDAAIASVFAELERLEQIFSTFRPSSEISRFNRGEITLAECSDEVIEVLDACTWFEHDTGGAFTAHPPARPGYLDPAGYVKGWATERAAGLLRAAGLRDWYVNVGGDVQVAGHAAPGQPWRVGIADPMSADHLLGVVEVADGAVATSGVAERGNHLWSNRQLDATLASVTVCGPSLAWADAAATSVFALGGSHGLDWLARFPDYQGCAVWSDHRVEYSPRFPGSFFGLEP